MTKRAGVQAKRVPGTNVTYKDLAALLETIMASPLITATVERTSLYYRYIAARLFLLDKNERLLRISDPESNNSTKR